METSHDPCRRIDLGGSLKRTRPPPAAVAVALTRAGRSRLARADVASEIDDGTADETDLAASRHSHADPMPSTAPRGAAGPALAGLDERPLADARDACQREGIAATRRELLMRVAKRVGLPQAEVARRLGGTLRREGAAAASGGPAAWRPRDPVSRLAAAILGVREREVFLARRATRPDDVAALHALAACLGLSVERVYELEASARRKLARALG